MYLQSLRTGDDVTSGTTEYGVPHKPRIHVHTTAVHTHLPLHSERGGVELPDEGRVDAPEDIAGVHGRSEPVCTHGQS